MMLRRVVNLIKSPISEKLCLQTLRSPTVFPNIIGINARYLHITSEVFGSDRRTLTASAPRKDDGSIGERVIDIDNTLSKANVFPDVNTPNKLFDGIPFKDIPIVNIKCSSNNTLMTLTNAEGVVKLTHTCGCEGYKNARKGTNIAAQATAMTLSRKAMQKGYKTIRVRVRGLGPGRAAAVQGLQMAGMSVISITDYTPVTWNPLRPRKARRV